MNTAAVPMAGTEPRKSAATAGLSWWGIFRLGLVQAALGAIVVLTTSTLNRVMVVELGLAALVPGLLVALHYAVQATRPRMGYGSDRGGRRTPWIAGGMALLAAGGVGAAASTAWMSTAPLLGLLAAAVSFVAVGLGVSAAGTSLLVLLATRVQADRRAGAATLVWVMMIMGFAITAGLAGKFLDPYTPARLVAVSASVSVLALGLAWLALAGVENSAAAQPQLAEVKPPFLVALKQVWAEPDARRFTVFVLVSMIAYSAQDLILEPFAAVRFGFSPGETTQLSGIQHGGTLAGMLLAALAGRRVFGVACGSLRTWILGGCLASALALLGLVVGGQWSAGAGAALSGAAGSALGGAAGSALGGAAGSVGAAVDAGAWPLRANVFAMGVANGAFSIAAIGSMMALAGHGRGAREGTRMGLWGAAQAIGFAVGGVLGTAASDLARWLIGSQVAAYSTVFAAEAALFVLCAALAARIALPAALRSTSADSVAAVSPAVAAHAPRKDDHERSTNL